MRNYKIYFCLIVIVLIASINSIHAEYNQSKTNEKSYWMNIGIGGSSVGENGGSLIGTGSYQFNNNVLTLRVAGNGELFGKWMNEYGMLYGVALTEKPTLISLGIGLSTVDGQISHGLFSKKQPQKIKPMIGIPLEAQFVWRPLHLFGIGFYGFANINSEEPFYGFAISLQFGKF